jgi:hypothetical protein
VSTKCLRRVYDVSTTCLRRVYDVSTTCLRRVYDVSTTCLRRVYDVSLGRVSPRGDNQVAKEPRWPYVGGSTMNPGMIHGRCRPGPGLDWCKKRITPRVVDMLTCDALWEINCPVFVRSDANRVVLAARPGNNSLLTSTLSRLSLAFSSSSVCRNCGSQTVV